MKIAFLGYGNVGGPLADHLQQAGHTVTLAARDPESPGLKKAILRNLALGVAPVADAVKDAEVVFLATPFRFNDLVLGEVEKLLPGKVLIDCTNPLGPGFTHALHSAESGSAKVQRLAPGALVVKAFSIYGFENLENNVYPHYNVKPAMLFCGDDEGAMEVARQLIADLGWEPVDVGGLEQALHLEHMTLLWARMVRANEASPNLVWAALRR